MIRRVLAAVVALATALTLAACGSRPPTAEELVSEGWPDAGSDLDASVTVSVDAALSGEAAGVAVGEFSEATSMGLTARVRLRRSGALARSEGSVTMALFGMTYDASVDEWMVTAEDGSVTTYTRDADVGEWVEGAASADELGVVDGVLDVDSGTLTNLELTEEDGVYVVRGDVAVAALDALGLTEVIESVTGSGLPDGVRVRAELTYDARSRALRSMTMSAEPETLASDAPVALSAVELSVVVNATSGVELELPAELKS